MAKILVIDDNALARDALRLMLGRAGHQVAEAANGRIAIDLQRRYAADLIVTDIFMPEMDGIEAIREFRERSPEVKIIAISAGSFIDTVDLLEIAGQQGANATFKKPVDRSEFLQTIATLSADA